MYTRFTGAVLSEMEMMRYLPCGGNRESDAKTPGPCTHRHAGSTIIRHGCSDPSTQPRERSVSRTYLGSHLGFSEGLKIRTSSDCLVPSFEGNVHRWQGKKKGLARHLVEVDGHLNVAVCLAPSLQVVAYHHRGFRSSKAPPCSPSMAGESREGQESRRATFDVVLDRLQALWLRVPIARISLTRLAGTCQQTSSRRSRSHP